MVVLLVAAVASAGAWTRDVGSFYTKLGADLYAAPQYTSPATLLPGTDASAAGPFVGEQVAAYGEVGLLDRAIWRFQLAAAVPLSIGHTAFESDGPFGRLAGRTVVARVGDVRITPQVALAKQAPLAAALEVKVPAYRNDSVCAGNPYRVYCARPGEGQVDVTPWLYAGFTKGHGFAELGGGYRVRTGWVIGSEGPAAPLGDGPVWAVTGGWTFGELLAMLKADGVHVLGADAVTPRAIRAGPSVLYTVAPKAGIAVEARFEADVVATATSRGIGGGLGVSARR
jgi:hypothetical protein